MHARALITMLLGALAGACSSSGDSSSPATDSGNTDTLGDSGVGDTNLDTTPPVPYPAPHPPAPQVLNSKGPVLAKPNVVPLVFKSDPMATQAATFVQQLVADTSYWSGATAEYGVGPLSSVPAVTLDETAPASLTDGDVQTWLAAKIAAGAPFPQPDTNTVYAIFYPDGTSIDLGGGAMSCSAFGGYHSDFALPSGSFVSYAVMPRCPPDKHAPPSVTVFDQLTATTSHEIAEAATDPLPNDQPAYLDIDADDRGWLLLVGGGEIGDLCAPFPGVFHPEPGVDGFVQRVWSNAAAAASHDPCVPGGVTPYFNSAPVMNDTILVPSFTGGSVKAKGVKLTIGASTTIDLDLFSDAPTSGPWTVTVSDVVEKFSGGAPSLSLSLDKPQGQNGDVLHLTITSLKASPFGAAPFWIENQLGDQKTVWIGVVSAH